MGLRLWLSSSHAGRAAQFISSMIAPGMPPRGGADAARARPPMTPLLVDRLFLLHRSRFRMHLRSAISFSYFRSPLLFRYPPSLDPVPQDGVTARGECPLHGKQEASYAGVALWWPTVARRSAALPPPDKAGRRGRPDPPPTFACLPPHCVEFWCGREASLLCHGQPAWPCLQPGIGCAQPASQAASSAPRPCQLAAATSAPAATAAAAPAWAPPRPSPRPPHPSWMWR